MMIPQLQPAGALDGIRALVVDDDLDDLTLISRALGSAGCGSVLTVDDPDAIASLCDAWRPDLLVLDLDMPTFSRGHHADLMKMPARPPIVMTTAVAPNGALPRSLRRNDCAFVRKPLAEPELLMTAEGLLRHGPDTAVETPLLGSSLAGRIAEEEHDGVAILSALGEYHDDDPPEHRERVGATAARIAEAMEQPAAFVSQLRDAAQLHDIGKIAIPRRVLLKPQALSDAEREAMRRHVEIGAEILAPARSPVLRLAATIARTHHERWDGNGYLYGLSGDEIPLAGRITAVADVFDALTHDRPYRRAWDPERALDEITGEAGRQFDPSVVAAFVSRELDSYVPDLLVQSA